MISHLDDFIGGIVAELKLLGLYDDTLIAFTSDHGELMGGRDIWFKHTFRERPVKVPLLFHQPSRFATRRVRRAVTLADLCPTLSEIGGAVEFRARWGSPHSASLSATLAKDDTNWRDAAVMQHFGPGAEAPWFAIQRGNFKHVFIHGWGGMLINLADDPDEINDPAGAPDHAELAANLHGALVGQLDLDALSAQAKENRKQRCSPHQGLIGSTGCARDRQPDFDASKQYVRGGANKPVTC